MKIALITDTHFMSGLIVLRLQNISTNFMMIYSFRTGKEQYQKSNSFMIQLIDVSLLILKH